MAFTKTALLLGEIGVLPIYYLYTSVVSLLAKLPNPFDPTIAFLTVAPAI